MKKGRRVNLAIGYTGQAEVVRAGAGSIPWLGGRRCWGLGKDKLAGSGAELRLCRGRGSWG